MIKTHKKGFTIVELVIVIAVIAILAAVLIPTFSGIVDMAKDSAELQESRNKYWESLDSEKTPDTQTESETTTSTDIPESGTSANVTTGTQETTKTPETGMIPDTTSASENTDETSVPPDRDPYPWEAVGAKQPSEYTWAEYEALSPAEYIAFQNSFSSIEKFDEWLQNAQSASIKKPWDEPGAKQPSEYTWAEYEALSLAEQITFQKSFSSIEKFDEWLQDAQSSSVKKPWDEPGSKQPSEYTWAEYEVLSPSEQIAFQNSFASIEKFDEWLQNAQSVSVKNPWDEPGSKQPSEYTWAEYEVLSSSEQIAFQNSFTSIEKFDEWLQDAQSSSVKKPWDEPGAKQPSEYTWAEFEGLSPSEQIAFQNSFASIEKFDEWLQDAQSSSVKKPWDEPGAKQPSEYTWSEFEVLSPSEQIAFQNSFASIEKFDEWLQDAQSSSVKKPWDEPGAKQPSEYTWAEYEALSSAEQMAFQNSFVSIEKFDEWLKDAHSSSVKNPWDEPGSKQPSEYTWSEFEALSPSEQMAFQNSFVSVEKFDEWLKDAHSSSVKNPWDEPGAKQPSKYTWSEFEALSPSEQIAFQNSFASIEKFDEWLQDAQSEPEKNPWDIPGAKQPSEYTWSEFEDLSLAAQMAFQNSFSSLEEFDKWLMANMPKE